jgi:Na+/proline symporter
MDFYLRIKAFNRRDRAASTESAEDNSGADEQRMRLSRVVTIVWAAVLFVLAVLCLHRVSRVVEVGLQIASVAYGALLGAFLLGVLTRRANQVGVAIGMLCGLATEIYLWKFTAVPFTWWVMIGTTFTFAIGYIASIAMARSSRESS